MEKRTWPLFIHFTGCIIFLTLPFLFSPHPSRIFDIFSYPPSLRDFLGYLLLIGFFYLNYLVLIPTLYFQKKYFIYFMLVLLSLIIIVSLPHLLIRQGFGSPPGALERPNPFQDTDHPHRPPPGLFGGETGQLFFLFWIVFLLSLMLRMTNRWKQTEKEKLNAELSYLKAQINPHFLFNTLNSIYSLAIEKSDHTAPAVVKLSAMMRYVLSEMGREFSPLVNELNYIRDYIQLQQIRFGDACNLSFIIDGEAEGKRIAPLILIPFIENAFKYGVNAEEEGDIRIRIDILDKQLKMQVYNRKTHKQPAETNKSGLGISNTKNRLKLIYPSKHELRITDRQNDFTVQLFIDLI